MNEHMTKSFQARAEDPQWAYLMKELLPTLMSYTPGGINYNLNRPVDVRVAYWVDVNQKMFAMCELLGVNYAGRSTPLPESAIGQALELSVSGNLRKIRNQWKKIMKVLGWDYSDPLWRRPDGRDPEVWAQEWRILRAEMKKLYPNQYNEVLGNDQ